MKSYAIDPPDIQDRCSVGDVLAYQDEDNRAARWTTFVEWCKGDRVKTFSEWSTLLHYVYQNMRDQGDWHHVEINRTIVDFADVEGWPGVLRALARAMSEQDEAKPRMVKAELR